MLIAGKKAHTWSREHHPEHPGVNQNEYNWPWSEKGQGHPYYTHIAITLCSIKLKLALAFTNHCWSKSFSRTIGIYLSRDILYLKPFRQRRLFIGSCYVSQGRPFDFNTYGQVVKIWRKTFLALHGGRKDGSGVGSLEIRKFLSRKRTASCLRHVNWYFHSVNHNAKLAFPRYVFMDLYVCVEVALNKRMLIHDSRELQYAEINSR